MAPVNAPFFVAEELGFQQGVGNRGAVERHERLGDARTDLVNRLRDQLLARAGLAAHQHGRHGRRRLLDHLIDLAHLDAGADHLAERAALLELPAEDAHFAQRVVSLDDLVQQDLHALRIDRLGEVVVRADFDRFHRRLDGSLRRHEYHGQVELVLLFQLFQQVEAAQAGHDQIAQHDGRASLVDFGQSLHAVGGDIDRIPPAGQQLLQPHALRGVVFDEQNSVVRFGGDRPVCHSHS